MTDREKELQKELRKARKHLVEALAWCPGHYGAKEDLERSFQLLDGFIAWFEQTHA